MVVSRSGDLWVLRFHLEDVLPSESGGIEMFAVGLFKGLLGVLGESRLQLVCRDQDIDYWRDQLMADERVVVHKLPSAKSPGGHFSRRLRRFPLAWQLRALMRKFATRASSLSPRRRATVPVVEYFPFHRSWIYGRRAVVTLHDMRVFDPRFRDDPSRVNIEHNIRSARLLTSSWEHPYREICAAFPTATKKLVKIPFPAMNDIEASREEAALTSWRPGDRRFILYPAGVTQHKNHQILVEHARAYTPRDFTYVITGSASGPLADALRTELETAGLSHVVHFAGYVSIEHMAFLYDHAWAVVMPSLFEAASGPVMESMVRGVPVLCADLEVFRSQMSESSGDCGWFDPYDPVSLEHAIAYLRGNRAALVEASLRGGQWYRGLSWTTTANEYVAAIEKNVV